MQCNFIEVEKRKFKSSVAFASDKKKTHYMFRKKQTKIKQQKQQRHQIKTKQL